MEERDNREHAAMIIRGLRERQLAQDAADMLMDGAFADPELAGDTGVRPALGHELEDFALARREVAKGISDSPGGDDFLNQPRVDDGTAVGDPLERLKKVAHLGDPALQQVADLAPLGEQAHRAVDLDMRGEHEDAYVREFLADRRRGIEALGRMGGGHANIQHDQLWKVLANQPHQLGHIARQTDDLKAQRFEDAGNALAQEDIVVRDDHSSTTPGLRHRESIPQRGRLARLDEQSPACANACPIGRTQTRGLAVILGRLRGL